MCASWETAHAETVLVNNLNLVVRAAAYGGLPFLGNGFEDNMCVGDNPFCACVLPLFLCWNHMCKTYQKAWKLTMLGLGCV